MFKICLWKNIYTGMQMLTFKKPMMDWSDSSMSAYL